MKLERPMFDRLLVSLKSVQGVVHVRDAKLFMGQEGTPYAPFVEHRRDTEGRVNGGAAYVVYATINCISMPVETGIFPSIADFSECSVPMSSCHALNAGLDAVIDKPVEVLAVELEGKEGVRPKWQIWMIRDGTDSGFLHNTVALALSRPAEAPAK
jgi:hypothetical protein